MKSAIQVIALFVVIVGGVFGLTFFTQFTRTKETPTGDGGPAPVRAELLKQYEKTATWDPKDSQYVQEFAKGIDSHYDFLLSNASDKPVMVVLDSKFACTCTNLEVLLGMVPADGRAKLKDAKPVPVGAAVEPYLAGVQWTSLNYEPGSKAILVDVPAADAAGPQFAAVRFNFHTKEYKATTLKAQLQARQGSSVDYLTFDVPISIVAPVLSSTGPSSDQLSFGDLKPGERQERTFFIWSSTHDHFTATAQLVTDDPCIQVTDPRRLSAAELAKLPEELVAGAAVSAKTHPKCGYEMKVAVSERRGDNQLELGPFNRRLVVNKGTDGEFTVTLTGTVRGSIRVGEPADHDRVDLGVFPAVHGKERTLSITSPERDLSLAVDHVKPDGLQAELVPVESKFGPRQWKLTVTAPPNALAGPLPNDSAIYLKTGGPTPRRIRIPVTGNASG
ncbi:MAG TPA: hypothetical protein VGF55_02485 [Gemmataceae bacterium]|jgi:hypothetical protein